MNYAFLLAFGVLVVGLAAGQITTPPPYESPVDRQWDIDGQCHAKMVDALYRATDVTNPNQDKYLKAAEAFRQLDLAGQRCN